MWEVERKCNDNNGSSDVSQICQSFDTTLYIRSEKPILKKTPCVSHKENDICNFCLDCNIPVCSTCLTKQNKKHIGHILEANEVIYIKKEKELEEYAVKFNSVFIPHFTREQERIEEISKNHQDMIEQGKQKIIDYYEYLEDKIKRQRDQLIEEFEDQLKEILNETDELKSKTESNIEKIERKIQCISSNKDCLDIGIICHLKKDIEDFKKTVDLSYFQLPLEGKNFQKGALSQIENIVGCLEKVMIPDIIDFKVLGSVDTNTENIESISVNENDTIWTNSKDKVMRKFEMDLDKEINMLEKKPIPVNDIAMTKSGDLLLAVVKDNCIKTLNKSGTIKDFYNYKTGLLRTPIYATALHVQKNGHVLVGFKEDNPRKETIQKIFVLTPNGRKERQLELANEDRESLCTLVYRLTTNNNNDDIIIVDQISIIEGQIVAIDKSNQLKWCYNGNTTGELHNTFSPRGIVTTSQNNFIVCDERNNALHVLNENGQALMCPDLKLFGLQIPYAIAINNNGHILLSSIKQHEDNKEKAVISVLRFTGC